MKSPRHLLRGLLGLAIPFAASCSGNIGEPPSESDLPIRPGAPAFAPAPGNLRRLTTPEYRRAIADAIGSEIVIASYLEPDSRPLDGDDADGNERGQLLAIGSATLSLSEDGVRRYSGAAYEIATQAMTNPAVRARLVTCTPTGAVDAACAGTVIDSLGHKLFRRPLSTEERDAYVGVATNAGNTLGDFYEGMQFGLAAMLMSPNFVYRDELGDDFSTWQRRLTPHQLATRLAFFLWASPPDATLLAKADDGSLFDPAVLAAEVDRMLTDPDEHIRDGVRAFFNDMLALYDLDKLNKSPVAFVQFTSDVPASAREETLRFLENHVVDERNDYRDIFTSRTSFVDRRLASIYNVPAPALEGFQRIEYPEWMERRGLLGQVSFLALQSHPEKTSAVYRGRFVRERLMCVDVPPPPPNANTGIPEPSITAQTLRDRVFEHFQNPSCRGCHQLMDPIGLAFERFDALGRYRTVEPFTYMIDDGMGGQEPTTVYPTINPSGSLAGIPYQDSAGLEEILRNHPDVPNCLVQTMYRYATGHVEITSETRQLRELETAFANVGYDVLELMRLVATSDGFALSAPPVFRAAP